MHTKEINAANARQNTDQMAPQMSLMDAAFLSDIFFRPSAFFRQHILSIWINMEISDAESTVSGEDIVYEIIVTS